MNFDDDEFNDLSGLFDINFSITSYCRVILDDYGNVFMVIELIKIGECLYSKFSDN